MPTITLGNKIYRTKVWRLSDAVMLRFAQPKKKVTPKVKNITKDYQRKLKELEEPEPKVKNITKDYYEKLKEYDETQDVSQQVEPLDNQFTQEERGDDVSDFEEFIRHWGKKQFILRLYYRDRHGNRTVRRVEPYEIRYPYFWAYGLEPGTSGECAIRCFRLDRIENVERAKGRYWPRWEIKL